MAKKMPAFDYTKLCNLVEDAKDTKTVSAVIILAVDAFSRKSLAPFAYAAFLEQASARIYELNGCVSQ